MAYGGVWTAPPRVSFTLIEYAEQPSVWAELDGVCAKNGIDPLDLPAHRFLNMIYADIAMRADEADKNREKKNDPLQRKELDRDLEVNKWITPFKRARKTRSDVSEGAPDWWYGDIDASQGFLKAMGVNL